MGCATLTISCVNSLMDPCTHRVPVSQFSKLTGAPVLSVRYRLAPQHPFPAALVDAFVAYLSLIHPPAGSFHDPVPANKIILAGDSAGGNLSLSLLQTLLTLRRIAPTVRFHGNEVPIDLPGGVAATSPWCDISRSMPSVTNNAHLDYLVPPSQAPDAIYHPLPIPEDDVWPRDPPRVDLYCNASATNHPLVSPLTIEKHLWKDAPPVFISVGEEGLADEGLIVARKMHQVGVPVVVEQFEGLPHCYTLLMISTPQGKRFLKGFADFFRVATSGKLGKSSGTGNYIGFKVKYEREVPLEKLVEVSDEEAHERLRKSTYWRVEGEKELQKQFREKAKL